MRAREAFTLIEMLVGLALLGILLGIAAPPAFHWRDAAAVRAARDELAATLALTRMAAIAHGGASLWIDAAGGRVWIATSDRAAVAPFVDLTGRYGVELRSGATGPAEVHYDALGIGRLASRTVLVRRNAARAGVTISAYGRYRRW